MQYNRDPFGFGEGDELPPTAHPDAIPTSQLPAVTERLDVERPGMEQSWEQARKLYGGWPGLPPPLRFPSNSVPVWPTRVIVPDPAQYPNITERKRCLVIEPPAGGATVFQAQLQFSDYISIYAISGGARVQPGDTATFGVAAMEEILIQFTRDTGDQLNTGGQVYMSSIVGTGENPCPLGTPGWAFAQNQGLVVSGTLESAEDWRITLVFHCLESIPGTNLGMSRTPQYTADGRR